MNLGVVFLGSDVATVAEASGRAERAGFASAWTTEFLDRSATVTLAAMSAATRECTIGSAIMYAVGRSPFVLAAEARDLDEISGGRLILGLGTGTRRMMSGWHGAEPDAPAVRMEELVPLLRRFWRLHREPIEHQGRFYQVSIQPTAEFRPPLRERIPVYMAGVNPRMIRAAGTVCDGLVGHPLFTRRYVQDVVRPAIDDGRRRSGDASAPFAVAGYVLCAIHEDAAVARREVKAQIAFYSIVRTYRRILDLHGWGAAADEMRQAWSRHDAEGMIAAVPEEMVDTLAVAGTPDEAAGRLAATCAGEYDHTLLYTPSFGVTPERFAENVGAIIETFGVSGAGGPPAAGVAAAGRRMVSSSPAGEL
ncbi:MAG TPA: LLM class flavin-dependent oxidoreductase [Streptosporangiaceae bacterium]|nr:LLM class flavin-dependent oxidoreductase [Streptosporangiaceae bacterium]